MITLLLHLLRLFPFLFGSHRQLAVENLALRQQLAVYKRTTARPKLRTTDRLFWIWLARVWAGWRQPLVIVTPDTVLRWQRRRFREYWTKLSGRPTGGRPPVNAQINRAAGTRHGHPDPRSRRPPSSLPPGGGLISPHPSGPGSPVCHARALLPSGRSPWSTSLWSARRTPTVNCAASDPFLDSPGVPSPVAGASPVVNRVGRVLTKDRPRGHNAVAT